jgi:hypothetical protein
MMYIKNRNGRNYEGLLKIGFRKLLRVQENLQSQENKLLLFLTGSCESFHHSLLFTGLCSCHCSNHHSLRKINDLERLNKLNIIHACIELRDLVRFAYVFELNFGPKSGFLTT